MVFRKVFLIVSLVCMLLSGNVKIIAGDNLAIPKELKTFIKEIETTNAGSKNAQVNYKQISKNIFYVKSIWTVEKAMDIPAIALSIRPAFQPTFNWAPHLTPNNNSIIPQHIFRAPALIVSDAEKTFSIIPDLDLINQDTTLPWFMDMDAENNQLVVGLGKSKITEHVLYGKAENIQLPKDKVEIGFYIIVSDKPADIADPWRNTLSFMWNKWGKPLFEKNEPLHQNNLEPYVKQTYDWAFKNWKTPVWQAFELNGKNVGAPVFIVNVTQSPNYPGEVNEREFRSIWNQAWFNSLRSAQGLYRYAKRTKNDSLKNYALKTKELALAFPQTDGFFKSVIATKMQEVNIDAKTYQRSLGWDTKYFGNSNRNPFTNDSEKSPYHIADMSFTAYWMLVWYDELEKDERLLTYAKTYADALMKIQDKDGFFPAWLTLDKLKPMGFLDQSPETSISVTFLIKLYNLTKNIRYLHSAKKAMIAVMDKIIPIGQWEDFETYWSCSRVGSQDWLGKKVPRNNQFKQNNLSIFWTTQALLEIYKLTGKKEYLEKGIRTLDELLMYQAVWQPYYMPIRTLGGFGVMNADAEWNDSRQSLFAELIIDYGKLLNRKEYIQRGIAALKASFTMMFTPLNPATMKQWQQRWPFFDQKDYGFMMENYGHNGQTDKYGLGIGEFTIYDWGNGAAAEAYNRILDHYGAAFLKYSFKSASIHIK